jgi:hypothetical protein
MSEQTISSYLVSLGYKPEASLAKFAPELEHLSRTMSSTVFKLGGDFAKLQFGITSALLGVGAASAKVALDFADFDQAMGLGSMGAFLTKGAFTGLNEALKMTGVTLAQASWNSEANARFLENLELVNRLNDSLGPNAEATAKSIRDFKNEFSQLGEELKFLGFATGADLFTKLFGDQKAQDALKKFNEWLLNNLPRLADEFSTDLVPIMHDLWDVTKDTAEVFRDAFAIFQEIVGTLSGDTSLQTTAVTFSSVAKSVETTVHWVDSLLKSILSLEHALLTLDFSHLTGGDIAHIAELGLLTGTGRGLLFKGGKALLGAGGTAAAEGAGVALAPLAAVGAGGVGAYELWKHRDAVEAWNRKILGMPALSTGNLFNLPPGLLDAVGHQESGNRQFNKDGSVVTSSAGALGKFQLMPATARGLGVDPTNEADNTRGAATLLQQLLAHYGGDQAKSLAAYNWGEGNVDRSIRSHKGFYLDSLPAETQNYIRSIEGRMGNSVSNGGDIHNTFNITNPDPQKTAELVMDKLADQQAKQSRFAAAGSVGMNQ